MSMSDDLANLEAAILKAAPEDAPSVAALLAAPAPEPAHEPGEGFEADAAFDADMISAEVWAEQWGALHDMMGGMVQMRTGNACPLGDQARSAGGLMAAQACYTLMASTPFLANMFLSAKSTLVGQVMVIGMHGFACVQMVKSANSPVVPTA